MDFFFLSTGDATNNFKRQPSIFCDFVLQF